MGHKRYSGNHPRFSKRADERYDAKEAYNKDLSDSARLHYLENVRHDHDSPASMKDESGKTHQEMSRTGGMKLDNHMRKNHMSPATRHTDKHMKREAKRIARRTEGDEQDIYYEMLKESGAKKGYQIGKLLPKEPKRGEAGFQQDPQEAYYENMSDGSPFNACAIDEGGSGCIKKMGGSWRVISNKTDKPWPAKYGSESKAKAALRGYHAG